jgi:hypothetical protein
MLSVLLLNGFAAKDILSNDVTRGRPSIVGGSEEK